MAELAVVTTAATRPPRSARTRPWPDLDRSRPWAGTDDDFARYFAEVTLDVVEEATFRKRLAEEVGPRHVHLRRTATGLVSIPPHIEENSRGEMVRQAWTGQPKVDRSLYALDRRVELQGRTARDFALQRHVPALRAVYGPKNFGTKLGPKPFGDSARAAVLNKPHREPYATAPPGPMDDPSI